jgi:hypothetical protein
MGEEAQLQEHQDQNLDEQQAPAAIENEVEVVLETIDGEEETTSEPPAKRSPVIRDMRKRIKEQNRENKDLSTENATLRAQLAAAAQQQPAPPAPPAPEVSDVPPTLESCGYDSDKFQEEYSKWNDAQLDKKLDQRLQQQQRREQKSSATQQNESLIEGHYQRASELKVGDYEAVEDVAVAALGVQLVQAIQTTVDNSETLIYWLGKNPEKAAALAVQFEANPGKATFELGKLASRVSLRPKGGGAPDPDIPVRGGGGTVNASLVAKYQKALDEATNADNPLEARRKVREAAAANGVTLPYNAT